MNGFNKMFASSITTTFLPQHDITTLPTGLRVKKTYTGPAAAHSENRGEVKDRSAGTFGNAQGSTPGYKGVRELISRLQEKQIGRVKEIVSHARNDDMGEQKSFGFLTESTTLSQRSVFSSIDSDEYRVASL